MLEDHFMKPSLLSWMQNMNSRWLHFKCWMRHWNLCVSATLSKHLKSRDGQVSLSFSQTGKPLLLLCVMCRVFLGNNKTCRFEQILGFFFFLNLVKKESVVGVAVEGKRVNKEKANELQKRKNRWNETNFCLCQLKAPILLVPCWVLSSLQQEYPHIWVKWFWTATCLTQPTTTTTTTLIHHCHHTLRSKSCLPVKSSTTSPTTKWDQWPKPSIHQQACSLGGCESTLTSSHTWARSTKPFFLFSDFGVFRRWCVVRFCWQLTLFLFCFFLFVRSLLNSFYFLFTLVVPWTGNCFGCVWFSVNNTSNLIKKLSNNYSAQELTRIEFAQIMEDLITEKLSCWSFNTCTSLRRTFSMLQLNQHFKEMVPITFSAPIHFFVLLEFLFLRKFLKSTSQTVSHFGTDFVTFEERVWWVGHVNEACSDFVFLFLIKCKGSHLTSRAATSGDKLRGLVFASLTWLFQKGREF